MSRLSILPALLIGLPLLGCAEAPTIAPAAQTAAIPVADAQVTPTGSHVRGATPDPFTCVVVPNDVPTAPPPAVGPILSHSACSPFLQITGH